MASSDGARYPLIMASAGQHEWQRANDGLLDYWWNPHTNETRWELPVTESSEAAAVSGVSTASSSADVGQSALSIAAGFEFSGAGQAPEVEPTPNDSSSERWNRLGGAITQDPAAQTGEFHLPLSLPATCA